MSVSVGALVESRGDLAALGRTIAALQSAKLAPTSIAVWGNELSAETLDWVGKQKLTALAGHSSVNQAVDAWLSSAPLADGDFVWMLQAGDLPVAESLVQLAAAVERAPSLGLLAPKLVRQGDARTLEEVGLTLSPWGGLFSPAAGQLDQAQFDGETDSLAVGTRGLMVRVDLWRTLGGFDSRLTSLARAYDFSVRARLAGSRVEVVPAAAVQVVPLEPLSATDQRRSELQLKFAFAPLLLAVGYWIALPLWSLIRVGYQIAYKRLDLVFGELAVGFAAFFTPWRLLGLHRSVGSSIRSQLRKLRADWDEVLSTQLTASAAPNESAAPSTKGTSNLFWWLVALAISNFVFWPTDVAATGGALQPLSDSWLRVFAHAGSGWQSAGFGAAIPAHPVNWVLAALSAFTFWQPSLAVGLFLLVSRALAFWGVWGLASKVGAAVWLRYFAAFAFAFWPALTNALAEGNLAGLITLVAAPWLVTSLLSVVDAAGSKSSWQTQVGVSGLLLAVVVAASPSTLPLWLIFGLTLLATQGKRALRLVWALIPTAVLFAPYAWFMTVGFGQPALTMADPLASVGHPLELWQAAVGLPAPVDLGSLGSLGLAEWLLIGALGVLLLLALTASLLSAARATTALVAFWILAGALGWMLSRTAIANGDPAQNPQAVLGLAGLSLIFAVVIGLRTAPRSFVGLAAGLSVSALAVASFLVPSQVSFGPNRVLPAIVQAQWQQGNHLKVLQLGGSNPITANLVTPENLTLDGQSRAYELTAAMRQGSNDAELLAQVAANLVSASSISQSKALSDLNVGFVFAANPTGQLVAALDSSPMLEAVGTTELGRFWRVADASVGKSASEPSQSQLWSITKSLQFATLLIFGLIALPTAGRTRKHRDTELDEGESPDAS